MKICVIGTGYVGLVSGACFAEAGNNVICMDIDSQKVASLNNGHCPIFEPGLEQMVQFNRSEGRLSFTADLTAAVNESQVCFIAVGTPANEDGSADLTHVLSVAREIARVAQKKILVGTKSTVPVGTGDKIEEIFLKEKKEAVVFSNPEFLKEGDAVNDFMKPDRIVVGLDDQSIAPLLYDLYAPFNRQKNRMIVMSRRSAELTKYAANAMLATRISFMNELANLCEKVGANISDVRQGIGSDPRIGPAFLYAGMGYGGSCLPKDLKALMKTAQEADYPLSVVEAVDLANNRQKEILFKKIAKHFGGASKLKGLKMAVWGLTFKAKTDDIRESPALAVIDQLLRGEVSVAAYDPQARKNVETAYGSRIKLEKNCYDCLAGASALIIATNWNEFKSPDFERIKSLMRNPVIFDGRNLFNRSTLERMGFVYYGIGL